MRPGISDKPVITTSELVMQFPQQQGWKALFKYAPGKRALDQVNLSISQGEIFGMLGPNGAGKTTLVKVLSTLIIPTSGEARVAGLDVVKDSLEVRRRLGVVYGDERTFFWRLSALDNLIFYASLFGLSGKVARMRALELLDLVGLGHAANLRMHHYSSGMKQRASIARALLNDPHILIMDEPTRALDPIGANELRELVRDRVLTDRRTVLVATNIMAEAEALCDRIAFITNGRIQMTGEIGYLRSLLATEESHQLVVGKLTYNAIDELQKVPGVDSVKISPLGDDRHRLELRVLRDSATIPAVVREIVLQGGEVWSCGQRELSLDEMFSLVVEKSKQDDFQERVPA